MFKKAVVISLISFFAFSETLVSMNSIQVGGYSEVESSFVDSPDRVSELHNMEAIARGEFLKTNSISELGPILSV